MKKSIIIASIVIILALIGGGVFWYVKQRKEEINPPVVENNNLEEEQKANELQGEEIDTSEWLTYRNEEYGFEVKYPESWKIKNSNLVFESIITLVSPETEKNIKEIVSSERATEIPRGDIIISAVDTKGKTLEDYLNYNLEIQKSGVSYIDLVKFNKMEFNNYVAYEALLGGFGAYHSIYIENDQKIYRILFELKANKNQLNDVENKIISTFTFIN